MFDVTNVVTEPQGHTNASQQDDRLARAKAYFEEHGQGLVDAAAWLGGGRAGRAVRELIAEIAAAGRWQRRFTDRLSRLQALLELEHAHDPDHPTWATLASTHPDDPRVEAVCRHAEAIGEVLEKDPI